ncbi:MAG: hypothetical protein NTU45_05875 [Planctomycetota bacterium]|nr:hypothetical protein [Planctomycetota bacterium]
MFASIRMDGSHLAVGRALVAAGLALATQSASAEVTHYQARAPWEAATGAVTTIGIPNVPQTAFGMGGYFASQGVTDLKMFGIPLNEEQSALWGVPTGTVAFSTPAGWQVQNHVQFAAPIHSIAFDWVFVQPFYFELLSGGAYGQVVGSGIFQYTQQSTWQPQFFGLTSTLAFDRIRVNAVGDNTWYGGYGYSMSFATIVPAPMAGAAVALGLMCVGRGRRRSAR